jgi:hypothetical protein
MKPTRIEETIKILKLNAEEFNLDEKQNARTNAKSTKTKKKAKKSGK